MCGYSELLLGRTVDGEPLAIDPGKSIFPRVAGCSRSRVQIVPPVKGTGAGSRQNLVLNRSGRAMPELQRRGSDLVSIGFRGGCYRPWSIRRSLAGTTLRECSV